MPSFKITAAYDGTDYVGWQRQAAGTSIQGLMEDALRELDGQAVAVAGAGRTDAGVHALGQAASFTLSRSVDAPTVVRAMNARLPPDVRVLSAVEVAPTFHARFAARSKIYRYRIWTRDVVSPFERRYTWSVPGPLDVDAMARAARLLEGTHDFAAFQAAGGEAATTGRTIMSSCVRSSSDEENEPGSNQKNEPGLPGRTGRGGVIAYDVKADGFLRHMVRTIVGSLVEVGRRRRPAEWINEVLASRDRARAGQTAPASGLFLVSVDYGRALADEP
jgi:tRNA pseudouridine38-40 synthase